MTGRGVVPRPSSPRRRSSWCRRSPWRSTRCHSRRRHTPPRCPGRGPGPGPGDTRSSKSPQNVSCRLRCRHSRSRSSPDASPRRLARCVARCPKPRAFQLHTRAPSRLLPGVLRNILASQRRPPPVHPSLPPAPSAPMKLTVSTLCLVMSALVLPACTSADADGAPCCEDPEIWAEIDVTANPRSTLSAIVSARTTAPVQVAVEFVDAMGYTRRTGWSASGTEHELTVVGMRARSSYEFRLLARTATASPRRTRYRDPHLRDGSAPPGHPPPRRDQRSGRRLSRSLHSRRPESRPSLKHHRRPTSLSFTRSTATVRSSGTTPTLPSPTCSSDETSSSASTGRSWSTCPMDFASSTSRAESCSPSHPRIRTSSSITRASCCCRAVLRSRGRIGWSTRRRRAAR